MPHETINSPPLVIVCVWKSQDHRLFSVVVPGCSTFFRGTGIAALHLIILETSILRILGTSFASGTAAICLFHFCFHLTVWTEFHSVSGFELFVAAALIVLVKKDRTLANLTSRIWPFHLCSCICLTEKHRTLPNFSFRLQTTTTVYWILLCVSGFLSFFSLILLQSEFAILNHIKNTDCQSLHSTSAHKVSLLVCTLGPLLRHPVSFVLKAFGSRIPRAGAGLVFSARIGQGLSVSKLF